MRIPFIGTIGFFFFLISVLGSLLPSTTSAQCYGCLVSIDISSPSGYSSPTFNSRLTPRSAQPRIRLENRKHIDQHKIKKISVIRNPEKILKVWEFDSTGRMTRVTQNYYQKVVSEYTYEGTYDFTEATFFYRNDSLLKVDSTARRRAWIYSDTGKDSCWCAFTAVTTWKRGVLLNEQNRYYNEKYEGATLPRENRQMNYMTFLTNEDDYIYLESFPTDFEPDKMYKASVSVHHDDPECTACGKDLKTEFPLDCEKFVEPTSWMPAMSCGSSLNTSHSWQVRNNEKGLPAAFYRETTYHDFRNTPAMVLPPQIDSTETTPKTADSDSSSEIYVISGHTLGIPRIEVSETPSYLIEYEYYDE